jgi:DNA-binding transcriptional ArsR family regulator
MRDARRISAREVSHGVQRHVLAWATWSGSTVGQRSSTDPLDFDRGRRPPSATAISGFCSTRRRARRERAITVGTVASSSRTISASAVSGAGSDPARPMATPVWAASGALRFRHCAHLVLRRQSRPDVLDADLGGPGDPSRLRNLGLVTGERRGRSVIHALYDSHVAELLEQALYHVEQLRLGLRDSTS